MKTPVRFIAIVSAATLAPLGLAPTAQAGQPDRQEFSVNSDDVVTGWCSFPLRLQETGNVIVMTHQGSGDVVRERDIASDYRGTLTNLSTGDHVSIAYPGSLHITYAADGSHTTRGTGVNLIAPPVPSPATGALGLWLVRGQFQFHVDPDGAVTDSSLTGTQQNLCDELSP